MRLDQELDRAIAKRASFERVSVNFVVGRLLRRFVEWDVPFVELGWVSVPKLLIDRLTDDKDEEALELLGREVARDVIKLAATYVFGDFTTASVIEMLRRTSLYSGRFSFDFADGQDSHKHVLIIRHELGRQWSRYYVGLMDETFRVLLGEEVATTYTDSLCLAQLTAQ